MVSSSTSQALFFIPFLPPASIPCADFHTFSKIPIKQGKLLQVHKAGKQRKADCICDSVIMLMWCDMTKERGERCRPHRGGEAQQVGMRSPCTAAGCVRFSTLKSCSSILPNSSRKHFSGFYNYFYFLYG